MKVVLGCVSVMEGRLALDFRSDSSIEGVVAAGESPQPMVNDVNGDKDNFDMLIEHVFHALM